MGPIPRGTRHDGRRKEVTNQEIETLVLAAVFGSPVPVTREQIRRAINWAFKTRMDEDVLTLVLRGDVFI